MSSIEPPPLPNHAIPGLAQDLLASLLSLKGRTIEAIEQRRAALQKLEEILGADHIELQPSLEQLAIDLLRLEDFASAAPILERTYQYRCTHCGVEHADTRERLAQLTECLLSAKLVESAQPLLLHQLSVNERLLGTEHEDTLHTVRLLAETYHLQGNRSFAEELLRRAQTGFERTLGANHPKTLASLYSLFENLAEGPDPTAAEPLGEKLLSTSQQVLGFAHPLTISAAKLAAGLYWRRRDCGAASIVLRRALDAFPCTQSPLSLDQAQLQCLLAACLDATGQIDEAHSLVRSAINTLKDHLGTNHAETARACKHAAELSMRRSLRTPWGRFRSYCIRTLGRIFLSKR